MTLHPKIVEKSGKTQSIILTPDDYNYIKKRLEQKDDVQFEEELIHESHLPDGDVYNELL